MNAETMFIRTLPGAFRNELVSYASSESGVVAVVRSSCQTKVEACQWAAEYGKRSGTTWKVRRTYPRVERLAFRQDWVSNRSHKYVACPSSLTVAATLDIRIKHELELEIIVGIPNMKPLSINFSHVRKHQPRCLTIHGQAF